MAGVEGAADDDRRIWRDLRGDAKRLRDTRSLRRRLLEWLVVEPLKPDTLPNVPLIEPRRGRVGICCSGGGVRSAAYNLGALQVLREEGVLAEATFVAAVSGGSYIASAYATVAHCSPPGEDEKRVYAP